MESGLHRFAWISIGAAVTTIALKFAAWWVTGSVGLLSDALESVVNLVGAVAALVALVVAGREPDEEHAYGHAKAEYFSSGLEGALILAAAILVIAAALPRLFNPEHVDSTWTGIAIAVTATIINLLAARFLQRAGHLHGSVALDADATHLYTDVVTTAGVILGIVLIWLTDWQIIDPIIALAVAANIIFVGYQLLNRATHGLMDTALPLSEL